MVPVKWWRNDGGDVVELSVGGLRGLHGWQPGGRAAVFGFVASICSVCGGCVPVFVVSFSFLPCSFRCHGESGLCFPSAVQNVLL